MVLKTGPQEHIVAAIDEALSGRGFISPELAPRLGKFLIPAIEPQRRRVLSEREQEILGLVIAGDSNTRIARKLHISVSTVKKHLVELFRVFGVESRVQLVVAALR